MLLLQEEVAKRLGCSVTRVKYLRLSGALPFVRGRPVLIEESDLAPFLAPSYEDLKHLEIPHFDPRWNETAATPAGQIPHTAVLEVSNADGDNELLALEEVSSRLERTLNFVMGLLSGRKLGYIDMKPPLVRKSELWRYLALNRITIPEAFDRGTLSPGAEAALNAARQNVLADHLIDLQMEASRRRSAAEASRWRLRQKRTSKERLGAGQRSVK